MGSFGGSDNALGTGVSLTVLDYALVPSRKELNEIRQIRSYTTGHGGGECEWKLNFDAYEGYGLVSLGTFN